MPSTVISSEYDWLEQHQRQEYLDSSISRHNAEIRAWKDPYEQRSEQLREEVREINRYNMYINSDDYEGETIVIEKPDYD